MARALRAKTYGELDATVADLPSAQVRRRPKALKVARAHPVATAALVTVVMLTVIAVIVFVLAGLAVLFSVWLLVELLVLGRRRGGGRRQIPARR